MINEYQAKYYSYELSKRCSSDSTEKFGATLLDAKVDLNPHQVEASDVVTIVKLSFSVKSRPTNSTFGFCRHSSQR
jgi:hypothetical protein